MGAHDLRRASSRRSRRAVSADDSRQIDASATHTIWVPHDRRAGRDGRSPGILAETQVRLERAHVAAAFGNFEVERIPREFSGFDAVVANHVLYHVRDRRSALVELQRALKPGGRLIVATNAQEHLLELRAALEACGVIANAKELSEEFDLAQAAQEIQAVFGSGEVERRSDSLILTRSEPVVAYARSLLPNERSDAPELRELEAYVELQIARQGCFRISVAAGIVRALRR